MICRLLIQLCPTSMGSLKCVEVCVKYADDLYNFVLLVWDL